MSEKPAYDRPEEPSGGLPKTFDPSLFENRWYAAWERDGRFQPATAPGAPRFVMVIPPPNVTGRLHIGHAYGRTVEDILARWKRMQQFRVLWVPGTDHAGIATQIVASQSFKERSCRNANWERQDWRFPLWALAAWE